MKVVLFSLMIIFSCRHAVSQNWQLLGEDETGDCADISIPDFSLAFYAVDTQQDSLWLLFVYDTSTSDTHGDFGLVLGVDTNLVLDDGDYVWDGPNQSLHPDVHYSFIRNSVFQTQIANNPSNPLNAVIYESATFDSVSLRFPLSAFDADGRFNFLAGSIRWGVGPNGYCEELPNTGFFSVDLTTPALEPHLLSQKINVFPNPATSHVWVDAGRLEIKRLLLYDLMGNKVIESNGSPVSLSGIDNGTYLLRIDCGNCLQPVFEKITILNHD